MNRITVLKDYIEEIFTRINELPPVFTHLCEVAQASVLIALKRGEDAELATMAGLLHDIAYLRNHDIDSFKIQGLTANNHAKLGAEIAMKILISLNITSQEENEIICSSIRNHINKNGIDSSFDEVIKDADVLAHGLSNINSKNFRGYRWDDLCEELGIKNLR